GFDGIDIQADAVSRAEMEHAVGGSRHQPAPATEPTLMTAATAAPPRPLPHCEAAGVAPRARAHPSGREPTRRPSPRPETGASSVGTEGRKIEAVSPRLRARTNRPIT